MHNYDENIKTDESIIKNKRKQEILQTYEKKFRQK